MARHPLIWIDLENTPHVPFFVPIILELERAGLEILLTGRDFAQTKELAEAAGLTVRWIGSEYGSSSLLKSLGLLWRAMRLTAFVGPKRPRLAVGHGSRGLLLAARLMGIPSLTLYDYEGASVRLFNRLSTWVMVPDVIRPERLAELGLPRTKYLSYPGLKEEVYLHDAGKEEHGLPKEEHGLPIDAGKIVVTLRPPSATAHYRSERSTQLFADVMALLLERPDVLTVLLPRNAAQRRALVEEFGAREGVLIPSAAVRGSALLKASDLVVGGGGTMNREAAVLGVPVVSIFKGPLGAVDRSLIVRGAMNSIDEAAELTPHLEKRRASALPNGTGTRDAIVAAILRLATG